MRDRFNILRINRVTVNVLENSEVFAYLCTFAGVLSKAETGSDQLNKTVKLYNIHPFFFVY